MNKFYYLFLLFFHLNLSAQYDLSKSNLSGVVIESETKSPLEYATITVMSSIDNSVVDGSLTDVNGKFNIFLPRGKYNILVEYISYKTISLNNIEINGNIDLYNIELEVDYESLEEVEIIAENTTVDIRLDKKIYTVCLLYTSPSPRD